MTPNDSHIPEDDLVLFALQLLPEDRIRPAKSHVDACETCRREIARLQGDLVAYSLTSDIQAPPAESRDRLLRQIAREPRLAPPEPEPAPLPIVAAAQERPQTDRADRPEIDRPAADRAAEPTFASRQNRGLHRNLPEDERDEAIEPRRPGRAAWVLALTGWALAAGASFFAGLQVHQRQQLQNSMDSQQARLDQTQRKAAWAQDALSTLTAANATQMPLHTTTAVKTAATKPGTPAPASPQALVAYLADKGALVFIGTHMDPAPAGKTYELWLLPADGRNPMPAGTFKPDSQGSASIVMPQLPRGVAAKGFGITVEDDGGSDTPTLPIVMANS